jgi:hypothetical protein
MRKSLVFILVAFLIMVLINVFIIHLLYQNQLANQKKFLAIQIETCSNNIETEINRFKSDLNSILFSDDISELFSDNFQESGSLRKLEMFYSSYSNLIKNVDIYDNNKNVLNLFKDKKGIFISDKYIAQRQKKLVEQESVKNKDSEYQYYIPVFKNNEVYGNIVISIDLSQYIITELYKFHLPDIIYPYVIDAETNTLVTNFNGKASIEKIDLISQNLKNDIGDVIKHKIKLDSADISITSVYIPLKALDHKFGLAFGINNNFFIKSVLGKGLYSIGLNIANHFIISHLFFLCPENIFKKDRLPAK